MTVLLGVSALYAEENPRIQLKDGSIYIDGEKFFIKGIGYSPYRPGQWPGASVPPRTLEADFKRIRDAGFNTLRVWGTMPEDQLEMAEKYDLMVIQAVPLKSDVDFGYSGFIRLAESSVRQMCRIGKKHSNIIMYLMMNEPHADRLMSSGVDKTLDLYRRLASIAREEDPNRPVSMANAYWSLWLDQSMWDIVSFNTYAYAPSISGDIGYANFVKGTRSLHAQGRPFVVTEFGYSVSPDGDGGYAYGGNSQEEQADGIISCFRGLLEGGAAGGCVFEWNDEWWKAKKPERHDTHPEEWFGIVGIESKQDILGTPRKAYYALKEEFKLIVTEPREGQRIPDKALIEVNAVSQVRGVRYRIGRGKWHDLTNKGDWWRAELDASKLQAGLHTFTVMGTEDKSEITRSVNIIKCKDGHDLLPPVNIEVTVDKPRYKNGDIASITARVTNREGEPLKDYDVRLGIFNAINSHTRQWEGKTDERGYFTKRTPVAGKLDSWYYVYWAGADVEDYGYKRKDGVMGYVGADFAGGLPVKELVSVFTEDIKIDGIIDKAWLSTEIIELNIDTNFGEGTIESDSDLSAKVRVVWDKENLYLLADIKDDVPAVNRYSGNNVWNGDCVELFISVDPARIPETGYSAADFQILIGANTEMWIPGQVKGGVRNDVPKASRAIANKGKDGYILEARINIANFYDKPFIKFKKGDILGFDIAIGDADEAGTREGKIVWNGTEAGYKDSAVWGRLKLE